MPMTSRHSFVIFIACFIAVATAVQVSALNIDGADKYAWGENIGWINFGTSEGDVDVTITGMDGYAWGENVGWINMSAVVISGSTVSGYAWGENMGWISMNCSNTSSCGTVDYGVSVDVATGVFSGYAWGENIGWISFNCSNTVSCGAVDYKVKTTASLVGASRNRPDSVAATTPEISPSPSAIPTESPTATLEASPLPSPTETIAPTPSESTSPTPIPTPTAFPTPAAPPPAVAPISPPSEGQPPAGGATGGGGSAPSVAQVISDAGALLDNFTQTIFGSISRVVAFSCVGSLGAVSCGATSVATVAVGAAVAAAAMQNEVTATTYSLLQVVGIRKRAKVWGVVYDSKTKRPVPLAKIELYDASDRVLETRFADRDGRYGFLTSPSSLHEQKLRVRVRVQKQGYKFPSAFSIVGTDYVVYDNIYRGEDIVLQGDSVVRFNIPVDPTALSRVSFGTLGRGLVGTLVERLLSLGFFVGLVAVPLNLWFAHTTQNIVIAILFFSMNGIRMFALHRPYGVTRDAMTGKPLPFALVTINDLQGNRQGFTVSDERGRFILSGEQGKDYQLEAYMPANTAPPRSVKRTVRGVRRWTTRAWITADVRI